MTALWDNDCKWYFSKGHGTNHKKWQKFDHTCIGAINEGELNRKMSLF